MGDVKLAAIGQAVIYLGMVAGAVTAIAIVLRVAVVRPLQKWIREQIRGPLNEVHAEVTPHDHGDSLTERLDRIEQNQRDLAGAFADHLMHHPGSLL